MKEGTIIRSQDAMEHKALEMGFLPLFSNEIKGFSVEEMAPRELWFNDECDGPWEWKGPIICNGGCAYGKLFRGKAGFVSMEWLPDLANCRRHGYKMRPKSASKEQEIYAAIVQNESLLTTEIRQTCGMNQTRAPRLNPLEKIEAEQTRRLHTKRDSGESLETILTRLQMHTLIVVADFEYKLDKHQQPYGWGIARYTTPELLYGADILACKRSPEESAQRIAAHLTTILPQATDRQIKHLMGLDNI